MSKLAWLAEKLSERRVARQTSAYLTSLAQEPVHASRRNVRELPALPDVSQCDHVIATRSGFLRQHRERCPADRI